MVLLPSPTEDSQAPKYTAQVDDKWATENLKYFFIMLYIHEISR